MIPAPTDDDHPLDRAKALIAYAEGQIIEAGGHATTEAAAGLATAYIALAAIESKES